MEHEKRNHFPDARQSASLIGSGIRYPRCGCSLQCDGPYSLNPLVVTMHSPAQQHLLRIAAAQATVQAAPGTVMTAESSRAHTLMLAKLDTDRRRLKAVQSIERKIAIKRELLPDYADYVAGVLSANNGVQDEVLGYVLTWRIDTGDHTGALAVARYVLGHGLSLPDRFARTAATLIAEEPAEQALKAHAAGQPFDVATLRAVLELTQDQDMPDQVRAKLHLALGRHLATDQPSQALALLRRAIELNDKVGAKKDIEQLERKLRKETALIDEEHEPPPPAAPEPDPAPRRHGKRAPR